MLNRLVTLLLAVLLLIPVFALAETTEAADTVEAGDGIYTVEFGEDVMLADNDYYTITLTGKWRIPENNGCVSLELSIVNKTDAAINVVDGSWNSGECDTINGVEKRYAGYNTIQAGETFVHDWYWFTDEILEDAHDIREMVLHFSAEDAETREELPQSDAVVRVMLLLEEVVEPEPVPVDVTFAEGAVIADNDYVTVTLTGEKKMSDYGYFELGFKILNKTDRELTFQLDNPGKKDMLTLNGQVTHTSSAIGVEANSETTGMNGPNVEELGITSVDQVKELVIWPMAYDPYTQESFTDGFELVRILF